jgi:hypothetical protein
MAANVEAMVREGINAAKANRKDEARALLSRAVDLDPYNEEGWLWLSGLVESPQDQRTCLENVLQINPDNARARRGLAMLGGTPPAAPASGPATSVEWEMPSSAASSSPRAIQEPTAEEYDDWMSGLQIGSSQAASSTAAAPFFEIPDPDSGDDLFASGPFASAPAKASSDPFADMRAAAAASGLPFFEDDPIPEADRPPAPPPAPERMRRGLFGRSGKDKDKEAESRLPASAAFPEPPPPMPAPSVPPPRPSLLDEADDDEDNVYFEEGEGELFGFIPREIPETRLPGLVERVSPVWGILTFLLVVANLAAFVLLWMRLLRAA